MRDSEPARRRRLLIAVKIIVFIILFALLVTFLNRRFVSDDRIAQYLNTGEPSDAVFTGTSSAIRIAPLLVDEVSGLNTYNIATPLQTLSDYSLLLQESIVRGAKPGRFLVYLNLRIFSRETSGYDYGIIRNLTGSRKIRMLFGAFSADEYPEALLPCVYRRNTLLKKIDRLFVKKAAAQDTSEDESESLEMIVESDDPETPEESDTASAEPEASNGGLADEYARIEARIAQDLESLEKYYGKGFRMRQTKYQDPYDPIVKSVDEFYAGQVDQEAIRSLDEIAEICRQNGIEMILYTLPSMPEYILSTRGEGYGGFHDFVSGLAEKYGVPFWDLTYIRPEIAEVDSTIFRDTRHGNASFSMRFSRILGQLLREHRDGTLNEEKWFFDDYESYQKLYPAQIYSVKSDGKILKNKSGGQYIVIKAAYGRNVRPEYRVTLLNDGEDPVELCSWTENDHAVIGADLAPGSYSLMIEARQVGAEETERSLVRTFKLSE